MATTTPNFGWAVPTSTDLVKDGAVAIETLGDAIDASLVDLKGGTTGQVLAKASGTDMDFSWVTDATGIPATIFDAKGDIIAATAADTASRLAVGANNTVLTADSTTATGLKWATASSGALTLVKAATTFTNVADTGTTFDSVFSSTYKYYAVFVQEFGAATITDDFQMQLMYSGTTQTSGYNGSSMTAVYNSTTLTNITNASTAQFTITNSCGTSSNSTRNAGVINFSSVGINNNGMNFWGSMYNGYNEESNVFVGKLNAGQTWTGFKLKSSSSNITGVVSVYGYGN